MARKSVKPDSPGNTKNAPSVEASAAPQVEGIEDLTEVEAAISEAQRSAGQLGKDVDEASVDSVEAAVKSAKEESVEDASESGASMNDIVSALEEVERSQQSAGLKTSLKEYDKAIAGAVDDLLEGDIVSFDLVLESMKETTPPPSPEMPESDVAAEMGASSPGAASETPLQEDEDGLQGEVVDLAAVTEVSPEEQAMLEADDVDPVSPNVPVGVVETPRPDPAAVSARVEAPAESVVKSSSAAASSSVALRTPRAAVVVEPAKSAESASLIQRVRSVSRAVGSALGTAMPAVRAASFAGLRLMSLPMQFVPPKARDIVDWVALSLIFWVPIVWIFALFIVG